MRRGNLDIIAENLIEFNLKVFNARSFLFALFKACYITVSAVCRKAEIINFFVEALADNLAIAKRNRCFGRNRAFE